MIWSWLYRILMLLVAAIWAVPLVWKVYTSFRPSKLAMSRELSLDFTLENFINVWNGAPFHIYYFNTILIVICIFGIQMVSATMAAFAFARVQFAGKAAIFMLFLVQIMVPPDVLIFPNYIVIKDLSLVDTKLAIMLPFFASAFGIFLLRQFFKTVPIELDEAATVEGSSKWRILWRVYFPLARPVLVSFGLVSVSHHWNNFLWPLIVTNSVENRPLTVGLAIFAKSAETGQQWGELTAATALVVAPLLIAFFVFQRQFINSFMQSGIK